VNLLVCFVCFVLLKKILCVVIFVFTLVINIFLCTNNGLLTMREYNTATPCVMHTVFIFLEFLVVIAIATNDMIRRTAGGERECQ
jgi:hypothetical protein